MIRRAIAVAAALLALVSSTGFAQAKTAEPIQTTVCELLKEPARFNGKMVRVRAIVVVGFEFSAIKDASCPHDPSSGGLWFSPANSIDGFIDEHSNKIAEYAFIDSPADLHHPEKLKWIPAPPGIAPNAKELRELYEFVDAQYGIDVAPHCSDGFCPKYSVTAILVGRFDHLEARKRAVRTSPGGEISVISLGFGHLGAWASRLAVQSVSDVVATPIDRAVYLHPR